MEPDLKHAACYDSIHEMSMDKDEHRACVGRMLKQFFPIFIDATKAEEVRGTPLHLIAVSLTDAFAIMAGTQVQATCRPGLEKEAIAMAIDRFKEMITSYEHNKTQAAE